MPVKIDGTGYIGTANNIYTDANGRVGLGTNSPANRLHLGSGSIRLTDQQQVEWGGSRNAIEGSESGNYIRLWTNNLSRLLVDSSGYVNMPYQPCFHATSGSGATSAGNVIVFNTIVTNVSSSYNSTTGRFTAPIAGNYMFIASYLKDGGNSDTYVALRRNGSQYANMDATGAIYIPGIVHAVLTMAAGDYADVYVNGGTVYQSYRQFSGYLIG